MTCRLISKYEIPSEVPTLQHCLILSYSPSPLSRTPAMVLMAYIRILDPQTYRKNLHSEPDRPPEQRRSAHPSQNLSSPTVQTKNKPKPATPDSRLLLSQSPPFPPLAGNIPEKPLSSLAMHPPHFLSHPHRTAVSPQCRSSLTHQFKKYRNSQPPRPTLLHRRQL